MTPGLASSGLRRLLHGTAPNQQDQQDQQQPEQQGPEQQQPDQQPEQQRCELCAATAPPGHRHLVDLRARALRCACRPCALLFESGAAGAGHYRLVPERRRHLPEFAFDDRTWDRLRIPVQVAFFFRDSAAGRMVVFYPSPAGAVESRPDPATWSRVGEANPALARLAPDVEAVLVNRTGDHRGAWLVPIDDCYALVGLIRTHWRGLAGGGRVWEEISRFFGDLSRQSRNGTTAKE